MPGVPITQQNLRPRCPVDFIYLLGLLTNIKFLNLSERDFRGDDALPDNMPWKKIRVGSVTSQKIVYSFYRPNQALYDVCLYNLKSKIDCRILLTHGPNNELIRHDSEYRRRVQFDKPFSDLDTDMCSDSATNKLRILGSTLFLVAGHVETLYTADDFFPTLQEACYCLQHDGGPPSPLTPELFKAPPAKGRCKLPTWKESRGTSPKIKNGKKRKRDCSTDDQNPTDDDESFFVKLERV